MMLSCKRWVFVSLWTNIHLKELVLFMDFLEVLYFSLNCSDQSLTLSRPRGGGFLWLPFWIKSCDSKPAMLSETSRANFLNQPFVQLFHQKSQIFLKSMPTIALAFVFSEHKKNIKTLDYFHKRISWDLRSTFSQNKIYSCQESYLGKSRYWT